MRPCQGKQIPVKPRGLCTGSDVHHIQALTICVPWTAGEPASSNQQLPPILTTPRAEVPASEAAASFSETTPVDLMRRRLRIDTSAASGVSMLSICL